VNNSIQTSPTIVFTGLNGFIMLESTETRFHKVQLHIMTEKKNFCSSTPFQSKG